MKKKLNKSIFVVLVVTTTSFLSYKKLISEKESSNIIVNNIEALAGGEVSVGKPCMYVPYSWCWWIYPDEIIEAPGQFNS